MRVHRKVNNHRGQSSFNVDMKLGRPVGLVSGGSNPTRHSNSQTKSVGHGLMSNPANIDQSVPNLATIYMPIKSLMSSNMGQIESEHPELFALEFGKIVDSDFVYTLASTNIDQSTPNLVNMYVTIRSRMKSIMDVIGPELFELSALEFENLPYLTLFSLWQLQILTNQY